MGRESKMEKKMKCFCGRNYSESSTMKSKKKRLIVSMVDNGVLFYDFNDNFEPKGVPLRVLVTIVLLLMQGLSVLNLLQLLCLGKE